jgi:hypothetical protein
VTGCDRPPSWTSGHHGKHWGDLGKTELPNCFPLCGADHWEVHEGGKALVRLADGTIRVLRLEAIPTDAVRLDGSDQPP